jgi:hypothetical protein
MGGPSLRGEGMPNVNAAVRRLYLGTRARQRTRDGPLGTMACTWVASAGATRARTDRYVLLGDMREEDRTAHA